VNIYVNGKQVSLSQRDFISQGGEGKVFGKNKTVYKIYQDLAKMIPEEKIKELQTLDRDNILNPQSVIRDKKSVPIGFTMTWAKNTIPICKLFSNTFRATAGITNEICIDAAQILQDTTQFIHSKKILIVDFNEFNFMVNTSAYQMPYFIDVDSYQTQTYPATAIMPSIKDWTQPKTFSELTDWYSFAIIACQLFVGIHPYKGKHKKFKRNDMQGRCKAHISIFNSAVTIPKNVRDFGNIPDRYMDWFLEVFEEGKRTQPPTSGGKVGIIKTKFVVITSTHNFKIELVHEYESKIIHHRMQFGRLITKTEQKIYLNRDDINVSTDVDVVYTPKNLKPILIKVEKGKLQLKALEGTINILSFDAVDKMVIDNTIYVRTHDSLVELGCTEVSKGSIFSIKNKWGIMPNSTELFDSVVYQNILGKSYLTIPIPELSQMRNIEVSELDGYRVLDAKYDGMICVLYCHKGSSYYRFVLKFDNKFSYVCRITHDVDVAPVNFVTLESGACILITDDGTMEMFSNDPKSVTVNTIKDPDLDPEMMLCKNGTAVRFYRDNKLYSIKTRRKIK